MKPSKFAAIRLMTWTFKLMVLLFCGSCVTPVEISVEHVDGTLVLSGQVSNIADQNIIQLGRSAGTERLPYPLSGAIVTLTDDLGQSANYEEDPTHPGNYVLQGAPGVPGRAYHLEINSDGQTYTTLPEKMPESAGQLTTQFVIQREEYTDFEGTISTDHFIKIYTQSILPNETPESYFRWSIEEVFLLTPTDFPDPFGYVPPPCYVAQNADPQRIPLFDVSTVNNPTLEQFLIGSRIIDWTFLEKHYFTTYQSALTKDAFEYWQKVNILANQVGSIFDTPPAKIQGNVYNTNNPGEKPLGYFQAVNQTYDRFFIHPYDLSFPLLLTDCVYDGRAYDRYPNRCIDCLSARNSSFNRPAWF
jgi:hypothetical protein